MDIDVIILCSGDGRYFPQTLLTVQNQTLSPKTIYVVDNACAHSEYEFACKNRPDPRISFVKFSRRLPMTPNWQRCLSLGDSPFLVCMHDDDLWEPEVLERAAQVFSREKETTACLLGHLSFSGEPPGCRRDKAVRKREADFEFMNRLAEPLRSFVLSTRNLGHMCALIIRRGPLGFPIQNNYMPDQGYLANHAAYGRLGVDPRVSVHIRLHPGSVTTSYSGNGRSSLELISQIRNILGFKVEHDGLQGGELGLIAPYVPKEYLLRVLQACHSWPLRKSLLAFGSELMSSKPFHKTADGKFYIREHLGKRGWIAASLAADILYTMKEKPLPKL